MSQNQLPQLKKRSKEEAPQQSSTPDALSQLLALMAPLVDFHKAVESASNDDLRLFWDVRVVRGQNEPFMTANGSSTLQGLLHGSRKTKASDFIRQEIVDKIADPLGAKIQDMVCDGALADALADMDVPPMMTIESLPAASDVAEAALNAAIEDELT